MQEALRARGCYLQPIRSRGNGQLSHCMGLLLLLLLPSIAEPPRVPPAYTRLSLAAARIHTHTISPTRALQSPEGLAPGPLTTTGAIPPSFCLCLCVCVCVRGAQKRYFTARAHTVAVSLRRRLVGFFHSA